MNASSTLKRTRCRISGAVQGVGFRPTVHRLARARELTGQVWNDSQGVELEVQGEAGLVDGFLAALRDNPPPLARITDFVCHDAPLVPDESGFNVAQSERSGNAVALIPPDAAICEDCRRELFDSADRRFGHPFINCTNCGPRYTLTRSVPYDRPNTTMAVFPLCSDCEREYRDPTDRRFHAQPVACPACGPHVWLVDGTGAPLAEHDEALTYAAERLARGDIVAVRGLGGFHLACDATNEATVARLRERKNRPHKPLAVMVRDADAALHFVDLNQTESALLTGVERPITLCKAKLQTGLALNLHPDSKFLGLMTAYTPLHLLLLDRLERIASKPAALVMTSGNRGGEPIALGNEEALERLTGVADAFLLHNRDILVRADDSVVFVGEEPGLSADFEPKVHFLRRARGYVPRPVFLPRPQPSVLGVGPELKNTLCLTKGDRAFVSQHLGDMINLETQGFFEEMLAHFARMLEVEPAAVVYDLHPDYQTSRFAQTMTGVQAIPLQHHFAHVYAVLAERRREDPVIGLALDGTGFGEDGTLWGGEILYVDPSSAEHLRIAHLTPVPLPGGEAAVREPWRIATAFLHEINASPDPAALPWNGRFGAEYAWLRRLCVKRRPGPLSSSLGRLFDAVAALLGLASTISYEGQAAIRLEAAQDIAETGRYEFPLKADEDPARLDSIALFAQVHDDWAAGVPVGSIARRFHLGVVEGLAEAAAQFAFVLGVDSAALSGGVMQNRTISRLLPAALAAKGVLPLTHVDLPPGDGCISLGQAYYGGLTFTRG